MELYICRFESHHTGGEEYLKAGFDAAIDFQPWGIDSRDYHAEIIKRKTTTVTYKLKHFFSKHFLKKISGHLYNQYKRELENETIYNYRFDYAAYVNCVINAKAPAYRRYPSLMPMWDNSPRRAEHPAIFYNSTPEIYKKWLKHIISSFKPFGREENLLFINAWNEWGEGNHLEPCMKWGMQYLEATKEVLCSSSNQNNTLRTKDTIHAAKVSVIIPNFNHDRFLKERFDSVLNQTYQNYEVIILDDCSDDNSRSIIEQYRDHKKVTHIVYNETNSGSTFKQWQRGMQYATGEYIWIAESDDWCENNFLEVLVNAMEQNKHCSIAYAQSVCVDDNKKFKWHTYYNEEVGAVNGLPFIRKYMAYKNSVVNASMAIFRRKFVDNIPQDYISYTYCGDWLFWIELACRGDVYINNKSLNYFRKHDNDVTGKALATGVNIIEETRIIAVLFTKKIITRKEYKALLLRTYAKYNNHKHQFKQGQVHNILQAFEERFKNKIQFQNFLLQQKAKIALSLVKRAIANAIN